MDQRVDEAKPVVLAPSPKACQACSADPAIAAVIFGCKAQKNSETVFFAPDFLGELCDLRGKVLP